MLMEAGLLQRDLDSVQAPGPPLSAGVLSALSPPHPPVQPQGATTVCPVSLALIQGRQHPEFFPWTDAI